MESKEQSVNSVPSLDLVLDGYEGPIDVLLALAREQKVDLARISVLALVEQYIVFITKLKKENLEIAADYLVMAAWLVYLKSRLLLPSPPLEDEPTGEELAADLAFRLKRLEVIRQCASALMEKPKLGFDVFSRGSTESVHNQDKIVFHATLFELLKAYGDLQNRQDDAVLHIEASDLYSPDDALKRLEKIVGKMPDWSILSQFLPKGLTGLMRKSAIASHLVAVLELCRQGRIELRQDGGIFTPLWMRKKEQESL
jgi:segregation and condensation protein A